jgi:sigma-70-like protein
MRVQPVAVSQNRRIVASIPFVEALARRMAATMPNSIDIGDLVQDGVLGLIDAAHPSTKIAASSSRRSPSGASAAR